MGTLGAVRFFLFPGLLPHTPSIKHMLAVLHSLCTRENDFFCHFGPLAWVSLGHGMDPPPSLPPVGEGA